jgi:hypothetical protein
MRLNIFISDFCIVYLVTDSLSRTFATTRRWSLSVISLEGSYIECTSHAVSWLTIHNQSDCEFLHRERTTYFLMFRCRNIVLLVARFFDVAKFTTLTQFSLLLSCNVSFTAFGITSSSFPNCALKSSNVIFVWYLGTWLNTCSNSS